VVFHKVLYSEPVVLLAGCAVEHPKVNVLLMAVNFSC